MTHPMGQLWNNVGSLMATPLFVWAIIQQYFPYHLRAHIERYAHKFIGFLYPYITITFPEYTGERLRKSEAFTAIHNYLSSRSSIRAKRLKAEAVKDSKSLVLSMDDNEEVIDEFQGVKIWWTSRKTVPKTKNISYFPASDERRRGRMDKHIEMSYCGFEAFKILAMNYLDVEWDDSYDKIKEMLEEIEMAPADVAENLMPKYEGEETGECFKRLIKGLEDAKVAAEKKKAEEEAEATKMAEKEKEKKEKEEKKKAEDEAEAAKKEEKKEEEESGEKECSKCNGVTTREVKEKGHVEKKQNN
uniref:Uncharacterized protein n=1 Tax=Cucumis sativus TaxID=3659 RepID=A0A0A0LFC6_CUCSA